MVLVRVLEFVLANLIPSEIVVLIKSMKWITCSSSFRSVSAVSTCFHTFVNNCLVLPSLVVAQPYWSLTINKGIRKNFIACAKAGCSSKGNCSSSSEGASSKCRKLLKCIRRLPSPFHQFGLLVQVASAWSLTFAA
jgi:hypothetical protein